MEDHIDQLAEQGLWVQFYPKPRGVLCVLMMPKRAGRGVASGWSVKATGKDSRQALTRARIALRGRSV